MAGYIGSKAVLLSTTAATVTGDAQIGGDLTVDTNTLFVDAASNNVGIGTSSPQEKLHVIGSAKLDFGSAGGNPRLYFDHDTVTDDANYIQLNRGDAGLEIISEDNLKFDTNGSEAMRITSAGNVGIGTASPGFPLDVQADGGGSTITSRLLNRGTAATDDAALRIGTSGTAGDTSIFFGDGDSTTVGRVTYDHNNERMEFWTNSTQQVNIDSSDNLLVGMSASSSTSNGCRVLGVGSLTATRDGDAAAVFNRKTSDGTIVEFRKDGTTVATIGVESSDNVYFSATTGGGSGLQFWGAGGTNPLITPMTEGVASDAEVDLGRSVNRFKDLYLSGGVYLGGTGSANLLDDYEEGTWTVQAYDAQSGGNASPTTATGYYTKIGRIVVASLNLGNVNTTGMTAGNDIYFTLPFANGAIPNVVGSVRLYANVDGAAVSLAAFLATNGSRVAIIESRDNAVLTEVTVGDFISGSSDVSITITYFTT